MILEARASSDREQRDWWANMTKIAWSRKERTGKRLRSPSRTRRGKCTRDNGSSEAANLNAADPG